MSTAVAVEISRDVTEELPVFTLAMLPTPFGGEDVFGIPVPERVSRSPAEIEQLKRQIAFIARVFSKNYDMSVIPSPDGGWACGVDERAAAYAEEYLTGKRASLDDVPAEIFKPKRIFYDLADLANAPEQEVRGVLRHEVGHANHSDYRLLFKGQRLARDEGQLPTTWASISNALEDPWVNNQEIAGSDVVREQMKELYAAKYPEVRAKINSQPVTHQLGLNIIHYWLTGESIPGIQNKGVLDTFEAIKPAAEEYFKGINAEANFKTLHDKIWPRYKALAGEALKDEQLKQLADKLADKPQRKGNRSASTGGDSSESQQRSSGESDQEGKQDGAPTSQKNTGGRLSKVVRAIKRVLGLDKNKAGEGQESSDTPEQQTQAQQRHSQPEAQSEAESAPQSDLSSSSEQLSPWQQQASPELRQELGKNIQSQKEETRRTDQELAKKGQKHGTMPFEIDLTKLPSSDVEALGKILDTLPDELRKELSESAKQELDKKNAEALKRDGLKQLSLEKNADTGEFEVKLPPQPSEKAAQQVEQAIEEFNAELDQIQAQADAQAEQQRLNQQRAELQRAMQSRDMVKNGFREDEQELFARFKQLENSMQARVSSFIRALEPYLPKKREFEHGGEYFTGSKLNQQSVIRRAPLKDYRIYQRREPNESTEPRMFVTLIIDNSGSMEGTKMEESLKTAIFWGRVLKEFQIPFAIKLFGNTTKTIMSLQDDYDDARLRIKPRLVSEANAAGGGTNMGLPLKEADAEMRLGQRKYPDCKGAVFVISDSGANQGEVGATLKHRIEEMQKDLIVMNFILSTNAAEVTEARGYFGARNVIAPAKFEDLPSESFKVLRVVLDRALRVSKGND